MKKRDVIKRDIYDIKRGIKESDKRKRDITVMLYGGSWLDGDRTNI